MKCQICGYELIGPATALNCSNAHNHWQYHRNATDCLPKAFERMETIEAARAEYGDALLQFEKANHGAATAQDYFNVKLTAERVARAAEQLSRALSK